MFLAIREMKKSKARFMLIFGVIFLIAYLTFFLVGLSYGLAWANRTAIEHWNASGIILSDYANYNISASSITPDQYELIQEDEQDPINITRTVIYKNGLQDEENKHNIALFGVEDQSFLLPELVEGRVFEDETETVVSVSMKEEQGVELGDKLEVAQMGHQFKVVGFVKEAKYNTVPVLYVTKRMASSNVINFQPQKDGRDAVTGATPNIPDKVNGVVIRNVSEIEDLPSGLVFVPMDTFIDKIPGYRAQVLTFGLMIGFLVGISAVIIGIFMFILTMQKQSIFGIMKAQGISQRYISNSVLLQTLFVSFGGVLLGLILTMVTSFFLPKTVPFLISWKFFIAISALMVVFSLIGTIFSVRIISKIDPLQAIE